MGKAKSKGKSKSKASRARSGDRLANARKIGERLETVTRLLSPMEVDTERERVCSLLRDIERKEADAKNTAAAVKAAISELRTRLKAHTNAANTAKRDEEITIEEWLTDKNEVIRVRTDTGEIVGNRVARAADLQEPLPLKDEGDDEGDDEEEGDDSDDDEAEIAAKSGDDAGDFGEGGSVQ